MIKGVINIKKIAVCLPSYNESANIKFITGKVDKALSVLTNQYDCCIVNCDNNSPDQTNKIFNSTNTKTEKISIVTNDIGKGINIINFLKFCEEEDIDYAFMFDTDLKSFKNDWIQKMLNLLENGSEFVLPLYKRLRYEGNTTNHFVVPILYALYGKVIRQPIGGDYGFNKHYIKIFNKQILPSQIKGYGIDIYMILLGIKNNINFSQVDIGEKRHNPSYNKMQHIFIEVAKGLKYSLNDLKVLTKNSLVINDIATYNSISNNKEFDFYHIVLKNNEEIMKSDNGIDICELWREQLINYLINIEKNDENQINEMAQIFMKYVLTYWEKFRDKNALDCEEYIYVFLKKLRIEYLKRLEEINLNANN